MLKLLTACRAVVGAGEMNMEHRQVWKNSLYEPSARVPLIISGPGVAKGKVVSDTLVSLLDIYPVRAQTCCVLSDTMSIVELPYTALADSALATRR